MYQRHSFDDLAWIYGNWNEGVKAESSGRAKRWGGISSYRRGSAEKLRKKGERERCEVSPKTTFLPSHQGAGAVVTNHCNASGQKEDRAKEGGRDVSGKGGRDKGAFTCEEFVFGPRLAIDRRPGRSCL